ncbi:MAG: tetratricopeptide repeat protein [Planctomycetes bacterium]|nr:tetratricopeptide repeat protein [Planctomycetota bacterium]
MTPRSLRVCCFDLASAGQGGALRLQIPGRPLAEARVVTAVDLAAIAAGAETLRDAERARRSGSRVDPAGPMRAHGEAIYRLLDGPGRDLTSALHDAHEHGCDLLVVVRLLGNPRTHPACGWRFELAHDGDGHVARRRGVQFVVQYGDRAVGEPQRLDHGRLRILFMAYSPQGVEPVLDYEGEEEAVLEALAPNVEAGRVSVEVVEDGTLAELGRRLKTARYDVVYLSGHGELREDGPVLLLEDEVGGLDLVGTERLFDALARGQTMPQLVVLASCETAGNRDDVASMAAGLVARGVPAVLGWVRPVADADATQASRDLLDQLATGHALPEAAAFARRELADTDAKRHAPARTHGWSTMHLATGEAAGFALDVGVPPPEAGLAPPTEIYKFLGDGRMRVLQQGFVGRRRALQRLIRILRHGKDGDATRAGAVVIGMKGVGKSCLAGRAIDRHGQDSGELALLVLHGALDDATVLEHARRCAVASGDREAEKVLENVNEPVERRIERLLLGRWSKRALVVVLDDFEKNLELCPDGLARLSPFAAPLLGTLLPACRTAKAKVLITSTVDFELAPQLQGSLSAIELGPLEPSDVRKLWTRGRETDLRDVSPAQWDALAERLGRNARILDWARILLGGRSSREIEDLVAKAQAELPVWREGAGDVDAQTRLVELFLFHSALDRAQAEAHPDVRVFLERARVYELAVPIEALLPMGDGLQLDLRREIPALANVGLLEFGSFEGGRGYRVSPLVVAELAVADAERWHRAAAQYFEGVSNTRHGRRADLITRAWEHSLFADTEDLSDRLGSQLRAHLHLEGLYSMAYSMAERQIRAYPHSFFAALWAGDAALDAGRVSEARTHFELADLHAERPDIDPLLVAMLHHQYARVLATQGEFDSACERLGSSYALLLRCFGTEARLEIATSLHQLAVTLSDRRKPLEALPVITRALGIRRALLGTDEHRDVAADVHELARVLRALDRLPEARAQIEHSVAIKRRLFPDNDHRDVAASLHELGSIHRAQGNLTDAGACLTQALTVQRRVYTTDDHPDVAGTLHELALVLFEQQAADAAIESLRKVLTIESRIYHTRNHYRLAESEFALGMMLIENDKAEEGTEFVNHALEVLRAQVPGHPILQQIARISPVNVARAALGARQSGERGDALDQGLDALHKAGEPHATVAAYLDAIARRAGPALVPLPGGARSLDDVARDLPEDIAKFLRTVRDAALAADAAREGPA